MLDRKMKDLNSVQLSFITTGRRHHVGYTVHTQTYRPSSHGSWLVGAIMVSQLVSQQTVSCLQLIRSSPLLRFTSSSPWSVSSHYQFPVNHYTQCNATFSLQAACISIRSAIAMLQLTSHLAFLPNNDQMDTNFSSFYIVSSHSWKVQSSSLTRQQRILIAFTQ